MVHLIPPLKYINLSAITFSRCLFEDSNWTWSIPWANWRHSTVAHKEVGGQKYRGPPPPNSVSNRIFKHFEKRIPMYFFNKLLGIWKRELLVIVMSSIELSMQTQTAIRAEIQTQTTIQQTDRQAYRNRQTYKKTCKHTIWTPPL